MLEPRIYVPYIYLTFIPMKILVRSFIPVALLALFLTTATSCSKAPDNNTTAEQSTSSSNENAEAEEEQSGEESFTLSKDSSGSSSLPEFNTSTVDGKELSHDDLLGKVTVINYWGTWCPPCVEEMPHFQKTYEELNGKGFTILGIAIPQGGRGTLDDVKPFLKKHNITYPIVMHESIPMDRFQLSFGRISGLPTTLVLNQSGKLQDTFIGYTSKEKLKKAIDPLMKK